MHYLQTDKPLTSLFEFKIFFIFLISFFTACSLLFGYLYIYVLAFILFCVLTIYSISKPNILILRLMLIVAFFVPFQAIHALNPLNVFNPLILLGIILLLKSLNNIFLNVKLNDLKLKQIDKIYFLLLISSLISTFSAKSILGALNWIFYSFISGYLVYKAALGLNLEEIRKIIKLFIFLATLSAFYALIEYISGSSIIYGKIEGRLISFFGHPLTTSLVFALVIPFSLTLFLETRKMAYLLASVILFTAILLTFARGTWLALSAGLLIFLMFSPLKEKIKLSVLFFALSILIFSIPPLRDTAIKRLRENEQRIYSSFNIRLKSIPIAMKIIADKPFFGGGPFNATRYKEDYTYDQALRKTSFENSYLGWAVDLGIIGLFLMLCLWLIVIKEGLMALSVKRTTYLLQLAGITSFIILILNMATFNFDIYRLSHFIIWFIMGLNMRLAQKDNKTCNPI